jgi:BirA family biotin operon repressor/biotin-[acetyl-CoA-carboxylase] ligase
VVADGGWSGDDGAWRAAAGSGDVRAAVAAAAVVSAVEVVGAVPSTQDVARTRARDGAPTGTLVVAERQLAGRGRVGRGWDDDARPGASLAATLVLDPPRAAALVPHAAGLAVLAALADWPAVPARLKWPNDVVVRGPEGPRKLAGILVERVDLGRDLLLVGIGVNVDRRHLPPEADRAGVADLAGGDVDPARLLAGLVRGLDDAVRLLDHGAEVLLARYRAGCDTVGRDVRVTLPDGAALVGRADVDAAGRLVVATPDGPRAVIAGTVRDAPSDGA